MHHQIRAETRGSNFIIFDGNQTWQRSMRTSQAGPVGAPFVVSPTEYRSCLYIKEKADFSKAPVLLISACHEGMQEFNMWTCRCTLTHTNTRFWISMGLVKGLAVVSSQNVNYTKIRPCCSLNVITQFDKCYLGNMTGMTFPSNILPHIDVKALLILTRFLSPSLCFSAQTGTHTQRSTRCSLSLRLSLINNPRCASSLFLACTHTHRLALEYPTLHCSF